MLSTGCNEQSEAHRLPVLRKRSTRAAGGMGQCGRQFPDACAGAHFSKRTEGSAGAGMLLTEGSHAALIECTFTENKNHGYYRLWWSRAVACWPLIAALL